MKYASIDIGTNTLRLLVAEIDGDGALTALVYDRVVTRLGGGYTTEGGIAPDALERTLEVLCDFKKNIDDYGVEAVFAVATSVVRRAVNRDEFLSAALERCAIEIDVIDGETEARLTLLGVKSVVDVKSPRYVVMDIGGGSTEFVLTIGDEIRGSYSLDLGVVHLTEKFIKNDPPREEEIIYLEDAIEWFMVTLGEKIEADKVALELYSKEKGAVFVGTAGTATTLSAMLQELTTYDREKINNSELSYWDLEGLYRKLIKMSLKERSLLAGLEKGREDLIIAGAFIVLKAMNFFVSDTMVVSDAGLLEGVILDRVPATP